MTNGVGHQLFDQQGRGRAHLRLVAALLAGAALAVLSGCGGRGGQSGQMPARPPAQVTVATAVSRDVPMYLEEIGKTVAVENVSIVPQVGGKLIAAQVQDGDYVDKGELLFEIDPRPFEAALAAAQATLAQNKADRELAEIEYRRTLELSSKGSASALELDQDRVALEVAEAKVAAAQASVQMSELDVEYTQIRSPIDGRAGARLVDAGNVVKANDAPLQMVRRLDPIYVEFTITENELGTVRKFMAAYGLEWGESPERGLRVEVDIPGDAPRMLSVLGESAPATGPAGSAGPREGRMSFLDNAVQGTSGTIRLRATVPNSDHYFWPGQFVNVRLVLTTKKDTVLVPATAQQLGQQGPYVYVVKADDTAELRPVTFGQRHGDLIVVESGVQDGERVVVAGQMAVVPNAKVRVTPAPAAPDGARPDAAAPAAALAPE